MDKSSFGKIALILIIIAAIGYGGYYLLAGKKQPPVPLAVVSPTSMVQVITQEPTVLPSPVADDPGTIILAMKQALALKYPQATSLNVTLSAVKGSYARGMVTEQGGGGIWLAGKVNESWKLIWDGNGIIKCSDLSAYPDFPTDFIAQCWDEQTQKMVER